MPLTRCGSNVWEATSYPTTSPPLLAFAKSLPESRNRNQNQSQNQKQSRTMSQVDVAIDDSIAELVEEVASQIVDCIQQCIEVLRSELRPTIATAIAAATATTNVRNKDALRSSGTPAGAPSKLYTCMKEKGILERIANLHSQLSQQLPLQQYVNHIESSPLSPVQPHDTLKNGNGDHDEDSNNSSTTTNNNNNERYQVVHKILHPLWWMLTICYDILDRLPPPKQPQEPPNRRKNNRGGHPVPIPPRGMLSIAHYTDIACLLEFTVCTSVLPHMEYNILLHQSVFSNLQKGEHEPPQDHTTTSFALEVARGRRLPKSLAGRLPREALTWGIVARLQQQPQSSKVSAVPISSTSKELYQTFYYMAKLLALDRFRPMLLPRHLTDLYAAYLQSEECHQQRQNEISTQQNHELQPQHYFLDHPQRLIQFGLVVVDRPPPSQPPTTTRLVDSYLQAQAYQQLLRHGNIQTPKWMIHQVSSLLADLASRDLGAVIDVFVPTSHGNTGTHVDTSAASQRLGRALAQSFRRMIEKKPLEPPSDATASPVSLSSSSSSIGFQMARMLEREAFPTTATATAAATSYSHSPRQVAILETLWAMLMQLPMSKTTQATAAISSAIASVDDVLRDEVAPILVNGQCFLARPTSTTDFEIHRAIRRIGALFSYQSPSTKSSPKQLSRICHWLVFAPFPNHQRTARTSSQDNGNMSINNDHPSQRLQPTPLGQLLRLASMETILHSTAKEEALQTLTWISNTLSGMSQFKLLVPSSERGKTSTNKSSTLLQTDGCTVLAMALTHALAPCSFDLDGHEYRLGDNESSSSLLNSATTAPPPTKRQSPLEAISIVQHQKAGEATTLDISLAITKRCQVLVEGLLMKRVGVGGDSRTDEEGGVSESITSTSGVACRLFQWCLGMYLSTLTVTLSSLDDTIQQPNAALQPVYWIPGYEKGMLVAPATTEIYRLVAMILLPLLCEKCSPTDLLLGDDASAKTTPSGVKEEAMSQPRPTNNVLEMVRLVLTCTATHYAQLRHSVDSMDIENRGSQHNSLSINSGGELANEFHVGRAEKRLTVDFEDTRHMPMVHANRILHHILAQRQPSGSTIELDATSGYVPAHASSHRDDRSNVVSTINDNEDQSRHLEEEDENLLLSISSIVLSLLIAMLELGSSRRSHHDEEMIQSFRVILKPLAEWTTPHSMKGKSASWSEAGAGLADMASYAMALVASRQATTLSQRGQSRNDERGPSSQSSQSTDKWHNAINEAREDLQSTQPPIRAKGMVSLGRLARGHLLDTSLTVQEAAITAGSKLIVEITDDVPSSSTERMSANQPRANGILEIVGLATTALLDAESYVYLAAVQTLVAVGDLSPRDVFPVLGLAVAAGSLKTDDGGNVDLVSEQRIKIAEALMFLIRRRAVTDEFVPLLVNMMVFGSPERIGNQDVAGGTDEEASRSKQGLLMQQETDDYFAGKIDHSQREGPPRADDVREELTMTERHEEQDIRLRTGGPVFSTEEADLVRAARVSVLVELVSASRPAAMAPYACLLVRLCIDALRLDTSRPVSRVASLLARELYGSILREQEELLEAMIESQDEQTMVKHANLSIPFTMAMISSKSGSEDVLFSSLKRQASFLAVMNDDDASKRRRYDPATSVRCREAVSWREQAEEGGIFATAKLLLSNNKMMESNTRSTLLTIVNPLDTAPVSVNKWATIG